MREKRNVFYEPHDKQMTLTQNAYFDRHERKYNYDNSTIEYKITQYIETIHMEKLYIVYFSIEFPKLL